MRLVVDAVELCFLRYNVVAAEVCACIQVYARLGKHTGDQVVLGALVYYNLLLLMYEVQGTLRVLSFSRCHALFDLLTADTLYKFKSST